MSNEVSQQQLSVDELIEQLIEQRRDNDHLVAYIREKIDQLLEIMGTSAINPNELDDQTLLELDPIGIICDSFAHVLDNLKHVNEELSLARDEIQTIFDTAGAAIMVLSPERKILAYNHKVEEFFLRGKQDAAGKKCQDVICADARTRGGCTFDRVVNKGLEDRRLEWSFNERSFDVVGRPIRNTRGDITHVILSYNDISERKHAVMALREALLEAREAKNRIKGILGSVQDALIVTDDVGRISLRNQAAERLLGGLSDLALAAEGSFAHKLFEHLKRIDQEHSPWVSDLTDASQTGAARVYQARSSFVEHADDERGGVITLLHDVTRDREVDRLKSDFVSTAAHELRTPLSTILGFSELILNEEKLPLADLHEYIGIVHQKAEGLAQIVNDLLDISRIESGDGLKLDFEKCNVREVCEDALLGYQVCDERYSFDMSEVPGDVVVMGDRFALAQVMENILSNAIKYSPDGTPITIQAEIDGDVCRLCVADMGMGMSLEQKDRIFEKFYRADASNTAISGTGLGMTIVKHIVEAHGGRVWVESERGTGTQVFFTLPLDA